MPIIKFKCNKLARDKTPESMPQQGITCNYKILDKKELIPALYDKLQEEFMELKQANNKEEITEEIADLFQVLDAIAKAHNISREKILLTEQKNSEQKGGYNLGIYVHEISMDEENPRTKHFRASPDKYKEIK